MRIPSGVTDQYVYFVAVDSTDFTTRETGLSSFTVYRSRNGGTAAAMTTPTINETDTTNMPGVYELLLDEDMTIDSGDDEQEMVFHITHAGMAPVTRAITLFRPKITAGNTLGVASDGDISGNVDGAVASVTGNVGGNVTGSVGSLAAQAKADVNAEADTALSDWGKTGFSLASTGLDAITQSATGMVEIAKAVWDRVISGANHNVGGSAGKRLREASEAITGTTGTAQAGASTTITLESGESAVDDIYNGERIIIIEGTGAGQARLISDYVGSTKVATVHRAWTTTPDNTSVYAIQGADVDVVYIEGVDATDQINAAADTAISDAALATAAALTTAQNDLDIITGADGVVIASAEDHATATALSSVATNVSTLLTRIPAALFSGITSLAEWLGLIAGKQTGDSTARTELRATGAGSGTFDETADSLEALRDHVGDGTNLTEAGGTGDHLSAIPAGTLTSGERDAIAAAILDLADGVETNTTVREHLRLAAAALYGTTTGSGTVFKSRNGLTDRITTTMSGSDRQSVALDDT